MAPSTFSVIMNNTNLDFDQHEYVSLDDASKFFLPALGLEVTGGCGGSALLPTGTPVVSSIPSSAFVCGGIIGGILGGATGGVTFLVLGGTAASLTASFRATSSVVSFFGGVAAVYSSTFLLSATGLVGASG